MDVNENIKKQKGWKHFGYVISCTSTDQGCERGPGTGIPDDPLKVNTCICFTASGFTILAKLGSK